MKTIEVITDINAPIDAVWRILTDFKSYKDWNSFIPYIEGPLEVGKRLTIKIVPPGKNSMTFTPMITQAEENQLLQWCGTMGSPILFKGIHSFKLEKLSDTSTRFIHHEIFTGLLVPLVFSLIGAATKQGFSLMNQAMLSSLTR